MQTLKVRRLPGSLALLVLAGIALSACDDSDATTNKACVDSLGDDFGSAFSQDLDDEPLDTSELDLTDTPMDEPFDVPC